MSFKSISIGISDGVMTLTLDRPDRRNALNRGMMSDIIEALDMADANDSVRAIIVTGSGQSFCVGVDLDEDDSFTAAKVDPTATDPAVWNDGNNRDMGGLLTLRFFNCVKPVIGAINGAAVGIGATML